MIRRFTIVSLDHIRPGDPPLALGVASIAAALRSAGVKHEVISVNVADGAPNFEDLTKRVIETECTDVAIGAFVWNEPYTQELSRRLHPFMNVGLGGPQITFHNSKAKKEPRLEDLYPYVHWFIRGPAEQPMIELGLGQISQPTGIHFAGENAQHFKILVAIQSELTVSSDAV